MFIIKQVDKLGKTHYVRYLGGRLLETGRFMVLGCLWTEDLQKAKTFEPRHVSLQSNVDEFIETFREKYYTAEAVNVRLVIEDEREEA